MDAGQESQAGSQLKKINILVVEESAISPSVKESELSEGDKGKTSVLSGAMALGRLLNMRERFKQTPVLEFNVTHVNTSDAALATVKDGQFDIILSDSVLPNANVNDMTLRIAKQLRSQGNHDTLLIQTDKVSPDVVLDTTHQDRIDAFSNKPNLHLPKLILDYAHGRKSKEKIAAELSAPSQNYQLDNNLHTR